MLYTIDIRFINEFVKILEVNKKKKNWLIVFTFSDKNVDFNI